MHWHLARNRAKWGIVLAVALLAGCSRNYAPDDANDPALGTEVARILPASEVLAGASIPSLDPSTMDDVQIDEVIGAGARCTFHYTSTGKPILAITQSDVGAAAGVVMLNGDLIPLEAGPILDGATVVLGADPIRFTIFPVNATSVNGREQAELIFEVGDQLRVGYRGYYGCWDPEGAT